MQRVAISVLMSIYKEPIKWVHLSIDSILQQTYHNFEFIIVNDNPEDLFLHETLLNYERLNGCIKYLKNIENIGLTKSLNKALSVSIGDFIARMDADDISVPNRLEMQINFMKNNPSCVVCGSSYYRLLENSEEVLVRLPQTNREIKNTLLYENCIAHPSVMMRSSVLKEEDIRYNENFMYSQDYELWKTLYNLGDFRNLETPLLYYRVTNSQTSSRHWLSQYGFSKAIRRSLFENKIKSLGLKLSFRALVRYSLSPRDREEKISVITSYYCITDRISSLFSLLFSGHVFLVWKNIRYIYRNYKSIVSYTFNK